MENTKNDGYDRCFELDLLKCDFVAHKEDHDTFEIIPRDEIKIATRIDEDACWNVRFYTDRDVVSRNYDSYPEIWTEIRNGDVIFKAYVSKMSEAEWNYLQGLYQEWFPAVKFLTAEEHIKVNIESIMTEFTQDTPFDFGLAYLFNHLPEKDLQRIVSHMYDLREKYLAEDSVEIIRSEFYWVFGEATMEALLKTC